MLAWLSGRIDQGTPKTSLNLYFGLLKTILNAATVDRVLSHNPCDGVKLTQVLRGLSREPKWVPSEDQVLALVEAVPARYRAAIWLGAGEGMRLGEVLGMEVGPRCLDTAAHELHVVQQLRYSVRDYGGFFLAPPKSGSSGTVDLDPVVAEQLAAHTGHVEAELVDITGPKPATRTATLLFGNGWGRPITDQRWSTLWAGWRDRAGWPEDGTFHALRHFFATTLMSSGVEPQEVQRSLRHANLRITLETYVHWLPKKSRPRGVVGSVLSRAAAGDRR